MKFLCVPCDRPMKLQAVAPPDRGSLSVVYSCPECGYEIAMLTNPYETQLVQSLGVRVGPEPAAAGAGTSASAAAPAATVARSAETSGGADASKCPFAAMMTASSPGPEGPGVHADGEAQRGTETRTEPEETAPIRWTSAAEARLANIPSFVRPMARSGIERFAREQGCIEVDEKVLDEAREFFGM